MPRGVFFFFLTFPRLSSSRLSPKQDICICNASLPAMGSQGEEPGDTLQGLKNQDAFLEKPPEREIYCTQSRALACFTEYLDGK